MKHYIWHTSNSPCSTSWGCKWPLPSLLLLLLLLLLLYLRQLHLLLTRGQHPWRARRGMHLHLHVHLLLLLIRLLVLSLLPSVHYALRTHRLLANMHNRQRSGCKLLLLLLLLLLLVVVILPAVWESWSVVRRVDAGCGWLVRPACCCPAQH
jgi:hypothetical protein